MAGRGEYFQWAMERGSDDTTEAGFCEKITAYCDAIRAFQEAARALGCMGDVCVFLPDIGNSVSVVGKK